MDRGDAIRIAQSIKVELVDQPNVCAECVCMRELMERGSSHLPNKEETSNRSGTGNVAAVCRSEVVFAFEVDSIRSRPIKAANERRFRFGRVGSKSFFYI